MSVQNEVKLDTGIVSQELSESISENGTLRCVFSTAEVTKVGTGTTTRKHVAKQYYYVLGIGDNMFSVRLINENYVPSGEGKIIEIDTLKDRYALELDFYEDKVIPAMDQLEELLDEGDEHRAEGQLYSAERSYNKALGMDEENLRALFCLGLVYLELEDNEKATDMMESLLKVKSAFDGKNEHLFNEFGISLRKSGLYGEAVEYYSQATSYVKDDENLYYNLARANYERNEWGQCVMALERCYTLVPGMEHATNMLNIIVRLAEKPELCDKAGKAHVPKSVLKRVNSILSTKETKKKKTKAKPLDYKQAPQSAAMGRARSGGKAIPDDPMDIDDE